MPFEDNTLTDEISFPLKPATWLQDSKGHFQRFSVPNEVTLEYVSEGGALVPFFNETHNHVFNNKQETRVEDNVAGPTAVGAFQGPWQMACP